VLGQSGKTGKGMSNNKGENIFAVGGDVLCKKHRQSSRIRHKEKMDWGDKLLHWPMNELVPVWYLTLWSESEYSQTKWDIIAYVYVHKAY